MLREGESTTYQVSSRTRLKSIYTLYMTGYFQELIPFQHVLRQMTKKDIIDV